MSFDLDNQEDNEIFYQSSLSLCFSSFEKIKENYKQANKRVVNIIKDKPSHELVEEIFCDIEASLALDLQPPSSIEFQITYEGLEAETYDQMMQDDFVPLCFETFQFLKEKNS